VVIAAAMSVVGAYYYLRVIKLMYFDDPVGEPPPGVAAGGVRLALGLNAAAVLILGVLPAPLLNLCARIIH
jgi:NADH-quinone oxidoreductase subunit N